MALNIELIHQSNEALLTSREKKFCEGIAAGKGKREAAVYAGYAETSAHVQAARNLKKDKIQLYIDRLRGDARRMTAETVDNEVKKLEVVYDKAMGKQQYTAAVNAVRMKAQLLGFLVEKKEVRTTVLDTLSDDELTKYLDQIKTEHSLN